jgi:HNH endonuclease
MTITSEAECIYCRTVANIHQFNAEHVLPKAFGRFRGALTLARPRRYRVCSRCNQRLGDSLDIGLARNSYEAFLRAKSGLLSADDVSRLGYDRIRLALPRDHGMAPMLLRLIIDPESGELRTAPMAQLRIRWGGSLPVCIPERNLSRELPQLLAQGKPSRVELFWWAGDPDAPDRIQAAAVAAGPDHLSWKPIEETAQDRAEEIEALLSLEIDQLILRAIAKIAYEYFFWVAENRAPRVIDFDLLDPIRRFILESAGTWEQFVHASNEPILADETATRRRTNGHLVALRWATELGEPIVGMVGLFNDIIYRVTISAAPSIIWQDIDSGHCYDPKAREVRPLTSGRFVLPPQLASGRTTRRRR